MASHRTVTPAELVQQFRPCPLVFIAWVRDGLRQELSNVDDESSTFGREPMHLRKVGCRPVDQSKFTEELLKLAFIESGHRGKPLD